ncbi:hypothetical protein [uncultured Paraglaciecola sp.]|uniref:hypothetical protein n=1 Tax=uncultured Paraglaciecola sp. TaxID=1765024 RepID=UPI002634B2C4|nr:hypothetical protein [uncultured Paraglaciecola sp.]
MFKTFKMALITLSSEVVGVIAVIALTEVTSAVAAISHAGRLVKKLSSASIENLKS